MSKNTNTISFLDSNKGHRQLVRNGFIYKMNKKTSTKIYWICKTSGCGASVHTDQNDIFLQSNGEHNHLIEPEFVEVQRFRKVLKDRVINETVPIGVYHQKVGLGYFENGWTYQTALRFIRVSRRALSFCQQTFFSKILGSRFSGKPWFLGPMVGKRFLF
jgi:hypothetical protein